MLQAFFAGMFIANGMPHFIKGVTGQTHMTPFMRLSSAKLNVLWAFMNFVLVVVVLGMDPETGMLNVPSGTNFWVFLVGAFFMSMSCAWLFANPKARFPWHKD